MVRQPSDAVTQVDELDPGASSPRRRRARTLALGAAAAVLLAVAGIAYWNARSSDPGGHRLLYTETLPDGRVFRCYTDGAAIGSAGTEVDTGEAPPAPDGSEGGPAVIVRPPDMTEEEARRAAEEYRDSGRSFEADQAEFDRLAAECRERR